ncbi:acyltransferase family protein [Roseivirga seohaensis]|uniref:acyltransferase family protein n=1 Tax=Roseivirga seohaensis TaxID=1914963 RepID=UPI003BAC49FB
MKNRLEELDGLRGIFALLVVCYHFSQGPQFDPISYTSNFVFRYSYIFVDFFFVLSGFVIAYSYSNRLSNTVSFIVFIKKRFIRLYPLLFYSVIVYVPLKVYGMFTSFDFNDGVYTVYNLIFETLDSLTFMNSTPILGSNEGMNPVSWSISAEMISYIYFGLTVLWLPKRYILLIIGVVTTILFFFLVYGHLQVSGSLGFLRGILGFSIGVLVYEVYKRTTTKPDIFEVPYLIILGMLFYLIDLNITPKLILIFPIWFGLGVFIFSKSNNYVSLLLRNRAVQFLGKISYSIYLNHFLVLWVTYFLFWKVLNLEVSGPTVVISFILTIVITIVYSFFTHKFIEIKFAEWLKGKLLKERKKP